MPKKTRATKITDIRAEKAWLKIRSALKAGFKCAYSNDAFELWFTLHYNYYDQQQHRSFYYEKLSAFWNINYEKNGKLLSFYKTIYNGVKILYYGICERLHFIFWKSRVVMKK